MKTEVLDIHPEFPDSESIARCAQIIRQGGLVVFPTETVYGIAADLSNEKTMKRLREVKKRPEGKPFSVLIPQVSLISNYTKMSDPQLFKMIERYWPGPLTVVVPEKDSDQTIGMRMPNNIIALKLVQESQCTIAAPSANFDSNPPPVTCKEALKDLDGLVDIAINGGTSSLGRGSTVVDFTQEKPTILREGSITQEEVDRVTGKKTVLFVCTGNSCRSVMAEYLLRDLLKRRDDVEVLSAGTGVFIQSRASADTILVLQEAGIDATGHVSQSLSTTLLKKSDLIFCMTRGHRQIVLERVPAVEKRVYLLREFASIPPSFLSEMDVPDPIGRSHQDYKDCLGVIQESINKVVDLV